MRLAAGFILNRELSRVLFYPSLYDHFDGLCLIEHRKGKERPWNETGWKNSPGPRLY